ncbi:MAG TPA: hypothetical protein ENK64_02090 [Flavobacteriales bacterium]|jgi:hypothetical protein|nr:hypothetical protein [Flavobacteriales bacterium]
MKLLFKISFAILIFSMISCDNNDDTATSPQDGFTVNNNLHITENAYITIDQADRNANGKPDYYNFFFTDGRITDYYGDQGLGYAYNYSTNITNLVKLQVFEGISNPNLTNTLTAGNTYVASSTLTTSLNGFGMTNSGYSKDSFIAYNLQAGTPVFGNIGGYDFTSNPPETVGIWHYPGTVGPSITINAINIDNNTPANSTIDVDYIFTDTSGTVISGHYEGTLGIILD